MIRLLAGRVVRGWDSRSLKRANMELENIKKAIMGESKPKKRKLKRSDFLSTGSALLNLALSGRVDCGYVKGEYHYIVGDSASGKTFLGLTCFAEAAQREDFDEYRFIFDDSEGGALMDLAKFFGRDMAKRLEHPSKHGPSATIEDFYFNLDDALNGDRPFIYLLDSMDMLSSMDEEKKFQETKKAVRKKSSSGDGEKIKGSYGDGKAKKNSTNMRRVLSRLRQSGSILLVISQTRDNIDTFSFEKKTRSGGRALRFYACTEYWSSIKTVHRKVIRGKKHDIGVQIKVQVKKNRLTGQLNSVEIPIYHSYGFDDIGSCVDFLVDHKVWPKNGNTIAAGDLEIAGSRDSIIRAIEQDELEGVLYECVQEVWDDIQDKKKLNRKPRY